MTQSFKNTFIIDHIDPLGQGVYKNNSDIYFIPKTLPGEKGSFEVLKSSKGVHFAKMQDLSEVSAERIESDCPHYSECNGCAYLHTSLRSEHNFKKEHLKRMLQIVLNYEEDISLISNFERFNYRNRIQLHYHKKSRSLGFMARKSKHIIPIKNCLLANQKIQDKLLELTEKNHWLNLIPKSEPGFGHLEISVNSGEVQVHWNENYAFGGFSQVNPSVNELFLSEVEKHFSKKDLKVLDLFGGKGNLVNKLELKEALSVDLYPDGAQGFKQKHLDLFKDSALAHFQKDNNTYYDTLFVDPPRSGFTKLELWTQELKPSKILYVSCHPATMVRDLAKITDDYIIEKVYLLDFFPSTYHFESAVYLTKK